ncbi:MAG: acyl carrier protein [Verrucomicrobiales bacterium]|jgi:acyl carrier protein
MTTSYESALVRFIQDEIVLDDIVVGHDTDLLLSGAVDSLGVVQITHWMEEMTGIEVDPGDVTLDNFQTVAKMVAYLDERVTV